MWQTRMACAGATSWLLWRYGGEVRQQVPVVCVSTTTRLSMACVASLHVAQLPSVQHCVLRRSAHFCCTGLPLDENQRWLRGRAVAVCRAVCWSLPSAVHSGCALCMVCGNMARSEAHCLLCLAPMPSGSLLQVRADRSRRQAAALAASSWVNNDEVGVLGMRLLLQCALDTGRSSHVNGSRASQELVWQVAGYPGRATAE